MGKRFLFSSDDAAKIGFDKKIMASFVKLWCSKHRLIDDLIDATREAEKYRDTEYRAVVVIQSWYRGVRVKALIKHLHQAASIIQRCFRAFRARKTYRIKLKEAVTKMEWKYYYNMATIIQKTWRGYWTRKYEFNYYARKKYLEGLALKNEFVRHRLEEVGRKLKEEVEQNQKNEEQKELYENASRLHYLVSTHQIPGVYNSPFNRYPNQMENHLREVKMASLRSQSYTQKNNLSNGGNIVVLPPLQTTKQQGPFRSPENVVTQRNKEINLSLRAETAYTSADDTRRYMKQLEKRMRIQDKPFQPFSHRTIPYEPTLHGSTSYGRIAYGTDHFRETDHDLDKHDKPFQSVTGKIEIFDKIGKTY
ncbi:Spermatogenesis-associated protein 17 [Trichoplax sp. H2]|nr:Spermatogenesis-associated protein 17 [Trichoplax sp. H2]|eukprot:RDD39838.1 Spermatogenesis-associated protein 17 [Trichoplax sp. H2]